MERKPFDGKIFGEIADAFSGTEQCDPQKKVRLGQRCVKILDSLGRRPEDFSERTTEALREALKTAILSAKQASFKIESAGRLFHLVREHRNRYYRVAQGTYTCEDSTAIVGFGQSIKEFAHVAQAA